MSPCNSCFTPFVRQCIVAIGASLNMASTTLLMAYTSGLALQLKKPDTEIHIDKSIESWIAAAPAVSALLGSSLMAVSMACLGRWISQIGSIIVLIIGWCFIIFAKDVSVILVGRFFHGLSMGAGIIITPILIGEWTSPKNRGAFMMLSGVLSGLYTLLGHTTALYFHWRTNAIISASIAVANLPLAVYSPESPSWLVTKQRYEDCRRVFRWLRGDDEEEELTKLIKASEIIHKLKLENPTPKSEVSILKKLIEFKNVLLKKEFYKPIFLILHVYLSGQWAGSHVFNNYIFDLLENVVGIGYNEHSMGLNINRVVGAILAVYIISKAKRRTMFMGLAGLNAFTLMLIAVYVFAKVKCVLPFDSPIIGLILTHLLIFFVTTCTLPMPYVIAGEIFPLKYKSVCSGLCLIICFISMVVFIKTFPYLVTSIGLHGAFTLYASIVTYSLVVLYFYLPETKNKTLQQIEEELVGKPVSLEDLKSVQSLIDKPMST